MFAVEGGGAIELHEDRHLIATDDVGLVSPSGKVVVGDADIGTDSLGGLVEFVEFGLIGRVGDGFTTNVQVAIPQGEHQGELIPFAGLQGATDGKAGFAPMAEISDSPPHNAIGGVDGVLNAGEFLALGQPGEKP